MRLGGITSRRAIATKDIDSCSDNLQMNWINAGTVMAEVIQLKITRDLHIRETRPP